MLLSGRSLSSYPATAHCLAATSTTPMTDGPPTRADAATAGISVIVVMISAAAGYALGSLVGLAVPLGLVGLFAGVVGGLALVHARFRRL